MSKFTEETTCDFDGCIGCYLCQPATPSPKIAKKNGERTLQSERFRKRLLNNQLEAGKSDNEDGNPPFLDPDHAEEDKDEEEVETVEAATAAPLVEQRAVELSAATTPPQPILPQTSL